MQIRTFSPDQFLEQDGKMVAEWEERLGSESLMDSGKVSVSNLTMLFPKKYQDSIRQAVQRQRHVKVAFSPGMNGGRETAEEIEIL